MPHGVVGIAHLPGDEKEIAYGSTEHVSGRARGSRPTFVCAPAWHRAESRTVAGSRMPARAWLPKVLVGASLPSVELVLGLRRHAQIAAARCNNLPSSAAL